MDIATGNIERDFVVLSPDKRAQAEHARKQAAEAAENPEASDAPAPAEAAEAATAD